MVTIASFEQVRCAEYIQPTRHLSGRRRRHIRCTIRVTCLALSSLLRPTGLPLSGRSPAPRWQVKYDHGPRWVTAVFMRDKFPAAEQNWLYVVSILLLSRPACQPRRSSDLITGCRRPGQHIVYQRASFRRNWLSLSAAGCSFSELLYKCLSNSTRNRKAAGSERLYVSGTSN